MFMKKFIFLLFLVLAAGCSNNIKNNGGIVDSEEGMNGSVGSDFNMSDVILTCDSLCNVDSDAYCSELRLIIVNSVEVYGTCRAFSRQGNVVGFNRCEGFCKNYPLSGTECIVNQEIDSNCDGIID